MKGIKKVLFVLFGTLLLNTGFSQQGLRIQLDSGFILRSNALIGDTFSFSVRIINDDTIPFSDTLSFGYRINNDTAAIGSNDSSGFEFDIAGIFIPPLGYAVRTLNAHVHPPAFKTGPSVVVIWPISANNIPVVAQDSLIFSITIYASNREDMEQQKIKLLRTGQSFRILKEADIQTTGLRIFDVFGQVILERQNPPDDIPLPFLNTGMYLIEITYDQNKRKVFRFYY